MKPYSFSQVVGGVRYSVDKSTLIASDCYWDGSNFERSGRNQFLYRTKNGRYFLFRMTLWQGERDRIEPLSIEEAMSMYERLPEQVVEYEEAFPGITVEEA